MNFNCYSCEKQTLRLKSSPAILMLFLFPSSMTMLKDAWVECRVTNSCVYLFVYDNCKISVFFLFVSITVDLAHTDKYTSTQVHKC